MNGARAKIFASPMLALGFGIFLALAETCRRWGNWSFFGHLEHWSDLPRRAARADEGRAAADV